MPGPTWDQQLRALTGPQRSAATLLMNMFKGYGLQGLAGRILTLVKEGASAETITSMLEATPEYQERFKANKTRIARGLTALTPKEYIETERAYFAVMRNSGMPKGFFDSRRDFVNFLEKDLSPQELNERVLEWQSVAQDADGSELRRLYGMNLTDYAAYLMSPEKALPLLKKQARAIQFASAAKRHGYYVSKGLAEKYGGGQYNVDAEEAEKGWAAIQEVQGDTNRLAKLHGTAGYSQEDAAAEIFGGDANAAKKRKTAASRERAAFSGSSKGAPGRAKGTSSY